MPKPLPSLSVLRQLITYDPMTGVFTWLPRTPELFACHTEAAQRKAAARWNAQYAGMPALIGIDGFGYFQGPVMGRYVKAHRVAWALHYGTWPRQRINHRNGDHRDNRIGNLRDVSQQACQRNAKRSARNRSGVAGVHWNEATRRWRAFIRHDGRSKALGAFASFADAVAARKAAEREFGYHEAHGQPREFANRFTPARDRSPR